MSPGPASLLSLVLCISAPVMMYGHEAWALRTRQVGGWGGFGGSSEGWGGREWVGLGQDAGEGCGG